MAVAAVWAAAAAALTQKVDGAEAALGQCLLPGRKEKKNPTKIAKPREKKEKEAERKWFHVAANPESGTRESGGEGGGGGVGGGRRSETADQPAAQRAATGTNRVVGTNQESETNQKAGTSCCLILHNASVL